MHFLASAHIHSHVFCQPRAAVVAQFDKTKGLVVEPGSIKVAKADTQWLRLPAGVKVCDEEGGIIKPSKGKAFYVTAESFDPIHLVCEFEA